MQKTVLIIGAGGKMGQRAAEKIGMAESHRVLMCENAADRAQALRERGYEVAGFDDGLAVADFVLLAVPDAAISSISHAALPLMKQGATLIALDAAAAYIGAIASRAGVTQMIAHPCHPAFFTEFATPEARRDHFGGVADQNILVALMEGDEGAFSEGVELMRAVFAPVLKAHRVTPEQFALLEPAMSEMLVATAAALMRAAQEAAVDAGVPREAAEAFMAGHAQIALAICFGAEKSPFSDAAKLAIEWGWREVIRPDWKRVFERSTLEPAIREMLRPSPDTAKP